MLRWINAWHKIWKRGISLTYSSCSNDWQVSIARPRSSRIKGANVYVSGLDSSMTSHDLEELFSPFGTIISCRVLCDERTGENFAVDDVIWSCLHSAKVNRKSALKIWTIYASRNQLNIFKWWWADLRPVPSAISPNIDTAYGVCRCCWQIFMFGASLDISGWASDI